MNLSCDIVMDLVGIYKDKIASFDTVRAVDEHLRGCDKCRRYYDFYDLSPVPSDFEISPEGDREIRPYATMSKRLKKAHNRKLLTMSVIAGAAAAVTAVNLIKMLGKSGR